MKLVSRKEAKGLSLSFYFTGKPCPKGHIAERRVHNGECRECAAQYKSIIAKTEKERDRVRNWNSNNRDKNREKSKKYYWNNQEVCKQRAREYFKKAYAADPDVFKKKYRARLGYAKQYYQVNKAVFRQRSRNARSKNPGHYNAKVANRRALRSNATPPWVDLGKIKEIYEFRVEVQNHFGEPYDVDHIIPLQGEGVCGLHVPWNLRVIPMGLNRSKHNQYSQDAALAYEHRT